MTSPHQIASFRLAVFSCMVALLGVSGLWAVPPTGITLDPAVGYEWCPPDTLVGTLTATGGDSGPYTYTLVTGTGSTHNFGVYIVGDKLHMKYGFERDFEVTGTILLYCRVRARNSIGESVQRQLIVTMIDNREEDFDGDGLMEWQEEDLHGTSDLVFDSDGDGVGDGAEVAGLTSPLDPNAWPDTAIVGWGDASLGARAAAVGSDFINLATGQNHSLALRSSGEISTWGGLGTFGQKTVPPGLEDAVSVSAGGDFWEPDTAHSLALKSNGTVVAWGYNLEGQLMVPAGLSGVIAISAGRTHCLALKGDGTVVAWGYNPHGTIEPPPGLNQVVAISAGGYHSLALKQDGTVVTWGNKFDGEYWREATAPVGLTDLVSVSAGRFHSLGLRSDGKVVAWGYNLDGQTDVPPGLTDVVAISAGGFHSMALKSDGSVVTWGSNSHGQSTVPPSAQEGIRLISAGILHSLAVAQGDDYPAITSSPFILGTPNVELSHAVTVANAVPAPEGGFSAIGLPPALSLDPITGIISGTPPATRRSVRIQVVTNHGTLTQNAWIGISEGLPPTSIALSPANVGENSAEGVVVGTLSALDPDEGDSHTFEWVDGSGAADNSWFRIEGNQLLVNTNLARDFEQNPSPFSIRIRARDASLNSFEQILSIQFIDDRNEDADGDGLTEQEEESVYFTSDTSYDSDGDGFGDGFEIAQGSLPGSAVSFPVEPIVMLWGQTNGMDDVPEGMGDVVALAAGAAHCLALASDGGVSAWGANVHGESTVPAELPAAIAVGAGHLHSVALLENGTVAAWGNNEVGQTNVPLDLANVVAVSAGAYHNVVLKTDGTVAAWGDNAQGQCNVPVGLSEVVAVAAGGFHSLALKSNGTVVAWGTGWEGISTVPGNLAGVIAIAAGGYHSVALKHDGTLVAWGWNDLGQCNIPANLPKLTAISAGWLHSLARKADGSLVSWGSNSSGQSNAPIEATQIRCFDAGWFHNIALRQTNGFPMFGNLTEVRSWPGESVSRSMPFLNAAEATFSAMGLPTGFGIDPASGLVTGTVVSGEKRAVRVSADTEMGTFAEIIWFNTADGLPATGITLSSNLVMENCPADTLIGTLAAIDPNLGDSHVFDLAYVAEGPDSFRFKVSGNQLLTRYPKPFDFEAGGVQLVIRVIARDSGNNSFEQNFTMVLVDDRGEDFDGDGISEAMEEDLFGTSDTLYQNHGTFDLDTDGVAGIFEYAFNLDPKVAGPPVQLVPGGGSTAGLPAITLVAAPGGGKRLRVEYIRRVGSILSYTPQFGTGLTEANWQTAANPVQITEIAPGWQRCVVEDSQTTNAASRRFVRVAVTW